MKYRLIITEQAKRRLRRLDIAIRTRIEARINALADNPHPPGSLKITGASENSYRIRIGDYRVIYEIHNETITVMVTDAGHRRDIYRHFHG